MPTLDSLTSLLGHYGYVIVFVGVFAESMGIPVPGETVLIAAGIVAHRGSIDLGTTIALGIAGAVLGDQLGYVIGRRGGRPFVLRWGRYVAITPDRLTKADAFFERHGGKAVFLARFVAGLRVFGALMAGVSRMRWSTFIVYNTLGGIVWATSAVLLGFFAGSSYHLIEHWSSRAGLVLVVLVVLVLAVHLANRHLHVFARVRNATLVRRATLLLGSGALAVRRRTPAPVATAGRWLARHRFQLLLLLACVLVPLALLGEIVNEVFVKHGFPWDVAILHWAHRHATPTLDQFAAVFSDAGSAWVLAPLFAVVSSALLLARRPMQAGFFALACAGALLLDVLARTVFERPRPTVFVPIAPEHTYAFPSAHAMGSMAFAVAVIILARPTRWGWAIGGLAALLTLVIGVSRIYLGLDYPTDVLAGWLAAFAWVVGVHLTVTARLPFDLATEDHSSS